MKTQPPCNHSASVAVIFLLLLLFLSFVAPQAPEWCQEGRTLQKGVKFSHCTNHDINKPDDPLLKRSTWCEKVNFHASLQISLRDEHFRDNCTETHAHCMPQLQRFQKILGTPSCEHDPLQDIQFLPARAVNGKVAPPLYTMQRRCKVAEYAIPFELTHNNQKLQLLLISTIDGFAILDMKEEKVLIEQETNGNFFLFTRIVSSNFKDFVHVIGANAHHIMDYKFELNQGVASVKQISRKELPETIIDMTTFFDKKSNAKLIAMLLAPANTNKPSMVKIFKAAVPNMDVDAVTWNLQNVPDSDIYKIDSIIQHNYDRTAPPSQNVKCFPSKDERVLIMIYFSSQVLIYGFHKDVGTQTLDLSRDSTNGRSLYFEVPTGSKITSVTSWGECFGHNTIPSQVIWLSVALTSNNGLHSMKFFPIIEMGWTDFECYSNQINNAWKAPSSTRRNTNNQCHSEVNPCPEGVNKQFRNQNSACTSRLEVPLYNMVEAIHQIEARISTDSKAVTNPNELEYTYQHHIFASTGKNIIIFSFQEITCSTADDRPIIEIVNTIELQDAVKSIAPSPNGQHLFATVYKRDWEIDSNSRFAEICSKLKANPSIPEFQRFKEQCSLRTYSNFTVYDYISYYSQCNDKWNCPTYGSNKYDYNSLNIEHKSVNPGFHTLRPTKVYKCEPGFYCDGVNNSRRKKCARGFKCPNEGMVRPVPCRKGQNYDQACVREGQITEEPCPDGFICQDSHSMTPSPPGYFLYQANRRIVHRCYFGLFCPLATSNQSNFILCPQGFHCPKPELIQPQTCVQKYHENDQVNNITQYCPAGSYLGVPCPAGYFCPTPTQLKKCEDGFFCPPGSQFARPCPAGTYCLTPEAFLKCPQGHYCVEGTVNPIPCQHLVYCPPGTTRPVYAFGAILIDIAILLVASVFIIVIRLVQRDIRKKKEKRRKEKERLKLLKDHGLGIGSTISALASGESVELLEQNSTPLILDKKKYTMDITLDDLSFVRKKNGNIIFAGVQGKIKNSRLTCILSKDDIIGQSLLDVLAGRTYFGFVDGQVLVNGQVENLKKLRNIIGYVHTNPIFHTEFKVKELLRFAAHARLPSGTTFTQVLKKVRQTLAVFDLEDYADHTVGKMKSNGIDTSHRKLVNIAMETIAEPNLLLLSQPTNLLDIAEAKRVVKVLREIAESGVTIVATLRRPQYEVFKMFDDVILMGEKGAVVYNGPTEGCIKYFEELGFRVPEYSNPCDFFLEILQGNISRVGDLTFQPEKLLHYWDMKKKEKNKLWSENSGQKQVEDDIDYIAPNVLDVENQFVTKEKEKEKKRSIMGPLGQYFLFFIRSLLEQIYHLKTMIADFLFVFVVASGIGAFYFNLEFVGPMSETLQRECPPFIKDICALPRKDNIAPMFVITSGALGIAACYTSIKLFGNYKTIYKREFQNGIFSISYYLGKMTSHLPYFLLQPFVFLSAWYLLVSPREQIYTYYGLFLLIWWNWSGFAYMISLLLSRNNALFVSAVVAIVSCMLSGYYPTLSLMSQAWYTWALVNISPVRWSFELMYLMELYYYERDGVRTESAIKNYGMSSIEKIWVPILILFIYGLIFRILGYFILLLSNPEVKEFGRTYLRLFIRTGTKKLKELKKKRQRQKEGFVQIDISHEQGEEDNNLRSV